MPGGYKNIKAEDGIPFTKENQPKKRRGKSLMTMIKKKIYDEKSEMIFKKVQLLDSDLEETDKTVDVKIKLKNAESLVLHFHKQLFKNDRLLLWLLEQEVGKAKQTVKLKIEADDFNVDLLGVEIMKLTEYIFLVGSGKEKYDLKKVSTLAKKLIKDIGNV